MPIPSGGFSDFGTGGVGPYTTNNPPSGTEEGPAATVTVGVVRADSNAGKFVIRTDGVDADYEVRCRYEGDPSIFMMGISSPAGFNGGRAAFCQLAAQTLLWIADWTALRAGGIPLSPNPVPPASSPWVLMGQVTEPNSLMLLGDGETPVYRLSGTYIYGHRNPSLLTSADTKFPYPPWMKAGFATAIQAIHLSNSIIDNTGGVLTGIGGR